MYFFSGIRRTRKGDEDAESTPDHGLLAGANRRDLGLTMHHRYIVTSSRLHSFPCMSGTGGGEHASSFEVADPGKMVLCTLSPRR